MPFLTHKWTKAYGEQMSNSNTIHTGGGMWTAYRILQARDSVFLRTMPSAEQ